MAAPMESLVAAGFIIFRRITPRIQYLLLQTSYGQHHWTPPKGHVDPGENEMETAIRETTEEAGLSRQHYNVMEGFKKTLRYVVDGEPKRVEYWLSELIDPNTQVTLSDEHQDFKWLDLTQAVELVGYPDMQDVLREADDFITKKL